MDDSIEQQHLQLNRDYLRILDNILFYLDQFNTRYNNMDYFNRERPRNRNRRNRWDFRQPLGSRFNRPPSNTIFRPSRTTPAVPTPPPPPPLFSNNTFTTPPRISRTFERSFFNSPFNNNTNTDNLTNFINNTLHVPSRPDYPTFNQVIVATTESTYGTCENINNQTMCTISREEFNNDDVVLKINHCGHIFKKNSLLTWFETNSRCPVCRHDIRNTPNNVTQNTDISNNNVDISNNNIQSTRVDTSGNNLYSPINLRNNTTQNSSTNNVFDISNNDLNDMLNNNLTQVLDNIGSAVLDNIETMVGNAFNNATDLSNNQINSAEFQYSFQLPPSSFRWVPNPTTTTNTANSDENGENNENDENGENID